jgi:hypothetical protein
MNLKPLKRFLTHGADLDKFGGSYRHRHCRFSSKRFAKALYPKGIPRFRIHPHPPDLHIQRLMTNQEPIYAKVITQIIRLISKSHPIGSASHF